VFIRTFGAQVAQIGMHSLPEALLIDQLESEAEIKDDPAAPLGLELLVAVGPGEAMNGGHFRSTANIIVIITASKLSITQSQGGIYYWNSPILVPVFIGNHLTYRPNSGERPRFVATLSRVNSAAQS
jgi:hypothetical protein